MSECVGGGTCGGCAHHDLLSAWGGTPIVDAHAPVGLELANHCMHRICGGKHISARMAKWWDSHGTYFTAPNSLSTPCSIVSVDLHVV